MTLTELIAAATAALEVHGDLEVVVPDPGCGCCQGDGHDSVRDAEVIRTTIGRTETSAFVII